MVACAFSETDPDVRDSEAFVAHLASGCPACDQDLQDEARLIGALAPPPGGGLRERVLDFAEAPRTIDTEAYTWEPLFPGIRYHVLSEQGGVRKVLIWGDAGARFPRHRHQGDEAILVLKGRLRDHRGEYGVDELCLSPAGSIHADEATADEDCVCYVVSRGFELVPD